MSRRNENELKVAVYSPDGVMHEISSRNAHDLVMHRGWKYRTTKDPKAKNPSAFTERVKKSPRVDPVVDEEFEVPVSFDDRIIIEAEVEGGDVETEAVVEAVEALVPKNAMTPRKGRKSKKKEESDEEADLSFLEEKDADLDELFNNPLPAGDK